MALIEVENLVVRYGAIEALHGVSMNVEQGQIVTLIGANGAGKTTLLRAISSLLPIAAGDVRYKPRANLAKPNEAMTPPIENRPAGEDLKHHMLNRIPAHKVVALGVSHVPEGRGIFPQMTVLENLDLGAYLRNDHAAINADREHAFELFPRIKERRTQLAGTLSGGEQQMLAIARALMARPQVLLLDEPSLGLAPLLVEHIFRTIKTINAQGVTVLLVEQNANLALATAHYAYVIETGNIVLHGPARDIAANPEVQKAYLGSD